MCGLIALHGPFLGADRSPIAEAALRSMTRRGPDGGDSWSDTSMLLGHRRLAVLDLDLRAGQPMHSSCGRFVIVFNGEIYNFAELRRERYLAGDTFHTTSDTEVLLAMFAAEGVGMLPKLRGMFAFVIWDRLAKRAFAARDPYGIKPLYYASIPNGVLIASQVKALLATDLISREPDLQGQAGFWMLGSVPEPRTWYRDIQALPAGHYAWMEKGQIGRPRVYWDIGDAWRSAEAMARVADDEVLYAVRSALRRSVAHHLVSDVRVGVFLSGGIDSGAIAGLMVEAGARDLQGITIAYDEFAGSIQDEAPVAAAIAQHYGIRHHVRRVTRQEFLTDLPRIFGAMDQPSIDGINTWYASKAVKELDLKVVLSGVGGDELFQGYESFDEIPRLVSRLSTLMRVPGAGMSASFAGALQAWRTGNQRWRYAGQWARTLPGAWWLRRSVHAPGELPALMGVAEAQEALKNFGADAWTLRMSGRLPSDPRLALGQIESTVYLRNQLLRDSDWASMDHSIELRTPLVDAWLLSDLRSVLPAFVRFPKKAPLAGAPKNKLPELVTKRRKTGFGIPVGRWLAERDDHSGGGDDSRSWAKKVAASYGGRIEGDLPRVAL